MKRQIIFALFLGSLIGSFAQSSGSFVYDGIAQTVSWLNLAGSPFGSQTTYSCLAGANCYDVNHVNVINDTETVASATAGPSAFGVNHIMAAGFTGNALGTASYFRIAGTSGNASGQYVGHLNIAAASAPDPGSLFAGNDNVLLGNGATGYQQLIGREIDLAAVAGSSVLDKIGTQIIQTQVDAVVGSRQNIGLVLSNKSGATGWDCGICFGNYAGFNPLNANSTIIGAWPHAKVRNGSAGSVPTGALGSVLYGLDWTNVTFGPGGAPIVMPLITPASSVTTCKAGSIEWDANFIYVCTSANNWRRASLAPF